tara:strand:- start:76 stop:255 length:180 start_codon:yes stop_codon:yes gene_type:complete
MKRNSYICVSTSVNENPAPKRHCRDSFIYNVVSDAISDTKDFEQLIEQLKQSVTQARTK